MGRNSASSHRFEQLLDRFLEGYFRFRPTVATELGLHQYDTLLEERRPEAIEDEIARLKAFRQQFQQHLEPADLTPSQQIDLRLVQSAIAAELLELEEIRFWQRHPGYYNWLASGAIHSLLIRDYAPLEDRLRAVVERARRIPALLQAGRENLRAALRTPGGVPRVWVEIAIEEFRGARDFFRTIVPQVAERVDGMALGQQVRAHNEHVVAALDEMIAFLRGELLEAATGDYALGEDLFRKKLQYEEAVTTPLTDILERGERELRRTQREMQQLAQQIEPGRSIAEVIEMLSREYPSPDELVSSYQRRLDTARQFVIERQLVTVPEGELRVVETPPFLRSLLFAALDPPGPFERVPLPTYFYVTPVEPSWSTAERDQYLRQHHRASQIITIFHEAYPGHYVQCAHCRRTPSRVRRIFAAWSFVEGWAHYAEQLMLDEGFGQHDPRLQLVQRHEALWRIGRLLVATRMHTEDLPLEAAVDVLMRECYQERANALREVKRYTTDPLVLVYAWGKWQIQDLRRDVERAWGSRFSLKAFHDELLGHGQPPIAVLRRLLLSDARSGDRAGSPT